MKCCLRLLFALCIIAGCQKEYNPGGDDNVNAVPAQVYLNTPYGSDSLQKMDIYLPAARNSATTPVIILVHGGAWASGDKADFIEYVDTLKKRLPHYAIFNINYRLASTTGNIFPTQENDVKTAFDFIVSKSGEYKVSQKFVLLGASAGGHLALLQAYKNNSPLKVKAVIDFFGPTDMVEMHDHPVNIASVPLLEILLGGTPSSNPILYQQSGPINFVTAQSPPTMILQGGLDPLVPVAQSVSLDTKLQAIGVVHQYLFYPTEGHGWTGANLTHSFDAIESFLSANVN